MRKGAMRFYVTAAWVGVLAALLVCSGCGAALGDSEAERYANKYWGERLSKCGDSYLAISSVRASHSIVQVTEYKGLSVWVNPEELSEADKLNGFEWRGGTGFRFTSIRFKSDAKGKMSDWGAGANPGGIHMWRKKGEDWQVEPETLLTKELHPDCGLLK